MKEHFYTLRFFPATHSCNLCVYRTYGFNIFLLCGDSKELAASSGFG